MVGVWAARRSMGGCWDRWGGDWMWFGLVGFRVLVLVLVVDGWERW